MQLCRLVIGSDSKPSYVTTTNTTTDVENFSLEVAKQYSVVTSKSIDHGKSIGIEPIGSIDIEPYDTFGAFLSCTLGLGRISL